MYVAVRTQRKVTYAGVAQGDTLYCHTGHDLLAAVYIICFTWGHLFRPLVVSAIVQPNLLLWPWPAVFHYTYDLK